MCYQGLEFDTESDAHDVSHTAYLIVVWDVLHQSTKAQQDTVSDMICACAGI